MSETSTPRPVDLKTLLHTIHGDTSGFIAIFSGKRNAKADRLINPREHFIAYPLVNNELDELITQAKAEKREIYWCAHLLTDRRRVKANAAQLVSLYADVDHAHIPATLPQPTVVIESSPGRFQAYWRLSEPIPAPKGEELNRRMALAMGADASGWDLTQLLRIPGTPNHKYADSPRVRVISHNPAVRHSNTNLNQILPPIPIKTSPSPSSLQRDPLASADEAAILERVRRTQRGTPLLAGDHTGYKSRSEADMALAYLLRGAGAGDDQGEQLLSDYSLAKADRKNPDDYIRRTWAKALAEVEPWPRLTTGGGHLITQNEPIDNLPDDVATLKNMIRELRAHTADSAELEQTRADLAEARRTISGMVHTFLNPHMVQSEKIALISALNIAEQKRQRGEVRSDGTVELTAEEISQDWRPSPSTGESVQPTNRDGSKPRMNRQQVKPIMQALTERGFVRARSRPTIKTRQNGSTYKDSVWDFEPSEKPADILAFAATWKPEEPKQRKSRSQSPACPECGEVHPIIRIDSCKGCCSVLSKIEIKPVEDTTAHAEPEPATTSSDYVHKNSGHIESVGFSYVHKNSGHRSAEQNLARLQARLTASPSLPPPSVPDPGVVIERL